MGIAHGSLWAANGQLMGRYEHICICVPACAWVCVPLFVHMVCSTHTHVQYVACAHTHTHKAPYVYTAPCCVLSRLRDMVLHGCTTECLRVE